MAIEYTPELGLPYPTSTNPVRVHTDVKDLAVKVDNTVGARIFEQVQAAKAENQAHIDSRTGSILGASTTYTDQKVSGVLGEANTYARGYATTGDNAVRSDLTPRISALEELGGLAPGDVSDATVASLIGNIATTSNQAVNTLVDTAITPGMVIATADRFPNLHPGELVDSAQGVLDAIAATPPGGTLVLPAGDYNMYTTMNINDPQGVRILAHGARFVKHNPVPLIESRGSFGTTYAVAAGQPSETTVVSDGEPQPATVLNVTGNPGWARGTLVKVVADDMIPERRPEDGVTERRVARFMVVESSATGQVVLIGSLNDPFTTNIRVAQLNKHSLEIHGLKATIADGMADLNVQDNTPFFNFISLHHPVLNAVTVERGKGTAFRMAYCYQYEVVGGCRVEFNHTSRTVGNYGYAVQDVASAYGRVDSLLSMRARTAFTDDSSQVAENSSLHGYGRSVGAIVSNSVAIGGGGSGFTTHHNGEGHQFVNVAAYDCLGPALGLRGRDHTARGVYSVRCLRAVYIFCEDIGGQSYGMNVDGVHSIGARHYAVRVQNNPTGHPQAAGVRETRPNHISNVVAIDSVGGNVYLENCTTVMRNLDIRVAASVPNNTGVIVTNNTELELDGARIDLRKNTTGTSQRLFQSWDARANTLTVAGLRVRSTSEQAGRVSKFFDLNVDTTVRARRVEVDYKFADMWTPANSSVFGWVANATNDSSAYIGTSAVTDEALIAHIGRTADPVITVLALPGANSQLARLPIPVSRGQQLIIINGNTANSLTLENTAWSRVLTKSGANLVLAPGQSASFGWNSVSARWTQL